jgi:hypothetical protein
MEVFDVATAERIALGIYDHVSTVETIEDASTAVAALDALKSHVVDMLETAKETLATFMGDDVEFAHSGYSYERKSGSPRKSWDHKALTREVTSRLVDSATDMDTGEIVKSPQELMVSLLDIVGVSYWKVTELSKIGINADNYCTLGESKTNIIIRKG